MTTPAQSPVAELRALLSLISGSVDKIEAALTERGQTWPLPDERFTPESEAARMAPDVMQHGGIIVAAAAQLINATRPPPLTLAVNASKYHISTCIQIAIQFHVAEILREGGPGGLHVDEIAAPTKVDASKLARILRVLATSQIFKEIAPDTFAHNRISSILDTGKSVSDILADPTKKHENTAGFAAFLEHVTDDGLKSSAHLPEVLADPNLTHSGEPNESAFSKVHNTTLPPFEWLELPENTWKLRRFAIAMQGSQKLVNNDVILEGFDWKGLPTNALIVDVGGGTGSQSLYLTRKFDHLKFVVQDREAVIGAANKFWETERPDAVSSGKVVLQSHDFFAPQPVQKPAVFFMRMILHDWSDKYCIEILNHLRAAAGPDTQLLIVDNILPYASADTGAIKDIPGAVTPTPPAPLLPNKGEANIMPYIADLQMLTGLNGSERTALQYIKLFDNSGWKLVSVHMGAGFEGQGSKIIAVPV